MSTNTETLVRASATIVNITTLHAGSVYKRLEAATSYAREKVVVGRVLSVMHNGTEAAITALESTIAEAETPKIVAHGMGAKLALFAATPEEWSAHMADVLTEQRRRVERAERDLTDATRVLKTVEEQIALPVIPAETEAASLTETPTA